MLVEQPDSRAHPGATECCNLVADNDPEESARAVVEQWSAPQTVSCA